MKNLAKLFRRAALCLAVVCPLAVSCEYDDTALKEQIDNLVTKVFELEQKMNAEFKTLKDLLNGKLLITDVEVDANTGITIVTLDDNRKLELLPEKDMQSFVTYKNVGGTDCWAYIDKDGSIKLFLNENNEPIPVSVDMPEVVVEDDETFIILGGIKYPLSGNSVFSGYELIKDEYTGEIYAVTFTFGEDMSFTATVDGAAGMMFVEATMTELPSKLDVLYVASGMTGKIAIQAYGVLDYILQVPDGWKVKEVEEPGFGKLFYVTAPSAELIKSGSAAEEGDLRAMAVLQGGKATVAKTFVTSKPFSEFSVSLGNATIVRNSGLYKYIYGVCEASQADEAALMAKARELFEANDETGVVTEDFVDASLKTIYGQDFIPGNKYVLWAVPAVYDDAKSEYFIQEGTLVTEEFSYASVDIVVVNQSSRDAKIDIEVKGAESYYYGLVKKDIYDVNDILYRLNGTEVFYTPKTELTYSGSAFEYAGVTAEPSTEYVAWVVVIEEGRTYKTADVATSEFKTQDLVPGSAVKVDAKLEESMADVVAEITAPGAETIYYAFLLPKEAGKYADDPAKAAYLFEKGEYVKDASVVAKASDFIQNLTYDYPLVLFAVASDDEGKYSEVVTVDCGTTGIVYNDLVVALNIKTNTPELMELEVSVTGGTATDYLYWIGEEKDPMWSGKLGGMASVAQEYMYLNQDDSKIRRSKNNYPVVDGILTMEDHMPSTGYVWVVMAKDASGLYSKATVLKFTPNEMDLGTVVLADDPKYSKAKPEVTFNAEDFVVGGEYGTYSYNVKVPSGFTAYVLSGTVDTFYELNTSTGETIVRDIPVEEKIISVIKMVDKSRDSDYIVGGKGVYYHFEHGDPRQGNVTIWASQEFHDSRCDCGAPYDREGTWHGNKVTIHHAIHLNDGEFMKVSMPYGIENKTEVVNRVYIVCMDIDGNCYQTFEYDVPFELFRDSKNEW